jgi:hypothetical protein
VTVIRFQNHPYSIAGEKEPSPFHRHENLTIVHVYSVSFRFSSIGGKVSVSSLDFLRLEKNFFFSS